MANPTLFLYILGGAGILLLFIGIILSRAPTAVEERLGRYSEVGGFIGTPTVKDSRKALEKSAVADYINKLGEGSDFFEKLSRHLAQADLKFRPGEYIVLVIGVSAVFFIIGYIISHSLGFAFLAGIAGIFAPPIYVNRAQSKRLKLFNNQLGDLLNLMVNGLRAGYSTLQAMEAVSRELPTPISDEFRRVVQEMQLGIAMEIALEHLIRRIDSDDLDLVITAINVQREVGGNLAEILDVISYTIRERVRIKGEISALTAQGRATAWVISALPVTLMLLLYLVNRPYFMQFFNPETRNCGIPMISIAGLMVVLGFAIVQKIVKIDI